MPGFSPFSFGFQESPGSSRHAGGLFNDMFYSAGMPGASSIYQDMFMRNLGQGRPGYAGFPEWFTSQAGAGDGTDGGTGGSGSGTPNFGNIPQWWIDWYNAKGKHGGVPPVQGLL